MSARRGLGLGVRLALAGTLVLLLAHATQYAFLTDDAFISFRYARNLGDGAGLVFNPGGEAVEGYTNFLWVVALGGLSALGAAPEASASVLSIALTVLLWWLVVRWALGAEPPPDPPWLVVIPPLLLAATRSVAVWSTSGLETRLFEVLVVGGVLCLAQEVRSAFAAAGERHAWSGWLLAAATLTRPDGGLIFASVCGAAFLTLMAARRLRPAFVAARVLPFAAVIGAHLVFRRLYYGDWLPNTYYAKVAGVSWWDMGLTYAGAFALEYALWTWVPLLVLAVVFHRRQRTLWIPLLFAAAVLPHALYVISIGGDHFEYRPFDLYFPFAFLLLFDGLRAVAPRSRGRRLALAACAVALVGLVALPWRSHVGFPQAYVTGFPGSAPRGVSAGFLEPQRDPIYHWPGLRTLARAHRALLMRLTSHFVGLRQEEHAKFLETVVDEGQRLAELVHAGTFPGDTIVAIDSVGAMPYYSGLCTLDRLGLTDRVVARSGPQRDSDRRLMAHDRQATLDYGREVGVDLWAVDPVHLLFQHADLDLVKSVWLAVQNSDRVWFADVGEGYVLLTRLPSGLERTQQRFARIELRTTGDVAAVRQLMETSVAALRRELEHAPDSTSDRFGLAEVLAWLGHDDEAIVEYETLLARNAAFVEARTNLGLVLAGQGRFDDAVREYQRALVDAPDRAETHYDLALALQGLGRRAEAVSRYRQALALAPDLEEAHNNLGFLLAQRGEMNEAIEHLSRAVELRPGYLHARVNLAAVLSAAGRYEQAAVQYRHALEIDPQSIEAGSGLAWIVATDPGATPSDANEAVALAEGAVAHGGGEHPLLLGTLAAAYARAGRFAQAVRTADSAVERAGPNSALVQRFAAQRDEYAAGRAWNERPESATR